jgi:putative transposase
MTHAIWLSHRFSLNVRDVEALLFARGVGVTYDTVRQVGRTVGQADATELRRRPARPLGKLGEQVFVDKARVDRIIDTN